MALGHDRAVLLETLGLRLQTRAHLLHILVSLRELRLELLHARARAGCESRRMRSELTTADLQVLRTNRRRRGQQRNGERGNDRCRQPLGHRSSCGKEARNSAISEARTDLELEALDAIPRLGIQRIGVRKAQRTHRRDPRDADPDRVADQAEIDFRVVAGVIPVAEGAGFALTSARGVPNGMV